MVQHVRLPREETSISHMQFNEAKVAQAAARFLKLRGGTMSYMKLIKLLYLADREAILRWGHPITTDQYVSMDKGPVLSRTLNLINDGSEPGSHNVWPEYVSEPGRFEVTLKVAEPVGDELSKAEKALIDEIFQTHGHLSRWQLVELVHGLPEWKDPSGSAIPITYRDILLAGNKTEDEIAAVESDLSDFAMAQALFLPR